jgi:hypothetical protein
MVLAQDVLPQAQHGQGEQVGGQQTRGAVRQPRDHCLEHAVAGRSEPGPVDERR